jgi:hypothetical protein
VFAADCLNPTRVCIVLYICVFVFVKGEVIGSKGVAEHVSRPGGKPCEPLQPLVPFAVTVCNDGSSNSRHWFQPGGEIVGDGNDSPLSSFRLSCCNFDELLLARQMHILPVERRELAGAEPGKEADRYGGQ